MSMPWFFVVEAVLLGITALGLLVVLIRAITAPGKNSQLELERDNGSIAITQNAIQSTVKHVVEAHHGLSTDNVKVDITNKHDPRMPSTPRSIRAATRSWASWAQSCKTRSLRHSSIHGISGRFRAHHVCRRRGCGHSRVHAAGKGSTNSTPHMQPSKPMPVHAAK